jgi:hypothetical protein
MIQQLSGVKTLTEDPYLKGIETMYVVATVGLRFQLMFLRDGHKILPHQQEAIDAALSFVEEVPKH